MPQCEDERRKEDREREKGERGGRERNSDQKLIQTDREAYIERIREK